MTRVSGEMKRGVILHVHISVYTKSEFQVKEEYCHCNVGILEYFNTIDDSPGTLLIFCTQLVGMPQYEYSPTLIN